MTDSLRDHLVRGAIFAVSARWIIKGLGFLNTIIMARVLIPEDYGIVAMSMLFVGLVQTFLDFGPTTALLRKKYVTQAEIDSAWSLRIIQGTLAALLVTSAAPLAVEYFQEPRLNEILWIFSFGIVISSSGSIGQTLALRDFNYTIDFKITTLGKIAGVVSTLLTGLFIKSYWSLVSGIIAGQVVSFFLSYLLHPYRPKWNTKCIPEIWSVTKWLTLSDIGGFLIGKADEIIAGRIATTNDYGTYYVGSDLGQMPVGEIGPAMQRGILPALSALKDDTARLRSAILKTFSAVSTVIWPIGIGFAAVAPQATTLLLGNKWHQASQYVVIFSLVALIRSWAGIHGSALVVLGNTKALSSLNWIELFVFLILSAVLVPSMHLLGLAYARLVSIAIKTLVTFILIRSYCSITYGSFLVFCYRPLVASISMYLLLPLIPNQNFSDLSVLITKVLFGLFYYSFAIIISWNFSGRPEGLESSVIDFFIKKSKNK